MIREGTISGKIGKAVFAEMSETGQDPETIVLARGYKPISDPDQLREIVAQVLNEHAGPVRDYLSGKEAALKFLMGQVMKRTEGRATPHLAQEAVLAGIEARRSETSP